uniref:Uncharacterized protein n=1 Tax=Strigamia maritima TaxID=126957 RepID=T1IMT9_STRMM
MPNAEVVKTSRRQYEEVRDKRETKSEICAIATSCNVNFLMLSSHLAEIPTENFLLCRKVCFSVVVSHLRTENWAKKCRKVEFKNGCQLRKAICKHLLLSTLKIFCSRKFSVGISAKWELSITRGIPPVTSETVPC